jgi:hypothetical protein
MMSRSLTPSTNPAAGSGTKSKVAGDYMVWSKRHEQKRL